METLQTTPQPETQPNKRYNEMTAVNIAKYILAYLGYEPMDGLKLIQLMYLADRENYNEDFFTITKDMALATNQGIILERTYELMNGAKGETDEWHKIVLDRNTNTFAFPDSFTEWDTCCISCTDIDVATKICDEFGDWTTKQLTKYTKNLPEWSLTENNTSRAITTEEILSSVGYTKGEIEVTIDQQYEDDLVTAAATKRRVERGKEND
jgi:hypothetical protein